MHIAVRWRLDQAGFGVHGGGFVVRAQGMFVSVGACIAVRWRLDQLPHSSLATDAATVWIRRVVAMVGLGGATAACLAWFTEWRPSCSGSVCQWLGLIVSRASVPLLASQASYQVPPSRPPHSAPTSLHLQAVGATARPFRSRTTRPPP